MAMGTSVKSRRKIGLVVFWTVLGVFILGALGVLQWEISKFVRARTELNSSEADLRRFYKADPFPSEENIEQQRENLVVLGEELDSLLDSLSTGQVDPPEWKQPTVFMTAFWETRRDLLARGKTLGIQIPDGVGMDRYLPGTPPAPDDVPRLVQQLTIIRKLCDILYAARISRLVQVSRDEFESGMPAGRVSPGGPAGVMGRRLVGSIDDGMGSPGSGPLDEAARQAGTMADGAQFATFRFVLVFEAKEDVLVDVLNRLAANEMFVVVHSLEVRAPDGQVQVRRPEAAPVTAVLPGVAAAGGADTPAEDPPIDSRVVSGRENPMTVKMEIDVYRFRRKAS